MNAEQLVQAVVHDTIAAGESLAMFSAELALCATIVLILLGKIFFPRRQPAYLLSVAGLGVALLLTFPREWLTEGIPPAKPIFTATLLADSFTTILRLVLLSFALLFVTFAQLSRVLEKDEQSEFHVLLLGALIGMCVMFSAAHVLIVVLGMEMASLPCYVLAGLKRRHGAAGEAALKYAVFGAGTAGIMLYGFSLLSGVLGSAHLPTMTLRLAELMQEGISADQGVVLMFAGLMVMVGVAFKLAAVPFHFWAPDVFEGATAEVAAFLSVASKLAALGLLTRLATGFAYPAAIGFPAPESFDAGAMLSALSPVRHYILALLSFTAAVSCTFGNLAAYGQTNMKRLLAYSTIAQAGYMMMTVAAAVSLLDSRLDSAREAIAALVLYLMVYMFMNLAAFAIVAFLRNALGSEEISDYAGLVHSSPGLCVCMALAMFSLLGLPPLAGFLPKVVLFLALIDAKLWGLLFIAALNTVLSLFYYLRVVRVMVLEPEPKGRFAPRIPLFSSAGAYCLLLSIPLVALFFMFDGLLNWSRAAAAALFR